MVDVKVIINNSDGNVVRVYVIEFVLGIKYFCISFLL